MRKIKGIIAIFSISLMICGCHRQAKDVNDLSNPTVKLRKADSIVRTVIVDNLYYPNTYDSITTHVDSAFSSIYTPKVVDAALNIIKAKIEREPVLSDYKEKESDADFWRGRDSWFYRQAKKDLQEPARKLQKLNNVIEENKKIIKSYENMTFDHKFIGWQIYHKCRCGDQDGNMYIYERLILANKDLTEWAFCISLDKNDPYNLGQIKKTIEESLNK